VKSSWPRTQSCSWPGRCWGQHGVFCIPGRQDVKLSFAGVHAELIEQGFRILNGVHDEDAVIIDNDFQRMSDREDGGIREVVLQQLLHNCVRVQVRVQSSSCLVQEQDLRWVQHMACQADKVLGAQRQEVGSHALNIGVHSNFVRVYHRPKQASTCAVLPRAPYHHARKRNRGWYATRLRT
jgi:hypothetical protein